MPFMNDEDDVVDDYLDEQLEKIEDEQREEMERSDRERRAQPKPAPAPPRLLALPPELPPVPLKARTPKERRAEAARVKRKRNAERKAQIKAVVRSTTATEALVAKQKEEREAESIAKLMDPENLGELPLDPKTISGWGSEPGAPQRKDGLERLTNKFLGENDTLGSRSGDSEDDFTGGGRRRRVKPRGASPNVDPDEMT